MTYKDTLKSYLPPMLTETKTFDELLNAEGSEFNNSYANLDDIKLQLNIDTATWGLNYYEKDLGITIDYTKDLDYRRSVIKSKSRGSGKFSATMIKLVCDSFSNGDVQVTFDGTTHVKFTNIYGVPPNISDLQNAVEQIKPAYLLLDYIFTYLTWDQFESYNLTWDQLEALNLTWNQLETYKR